jgi:hypothetical protein
LIYFEGTYTAAFSGAKQKTPRYDYNQIMYRLVLDDARLNLPVAVYRIKTRDGSEQYATREGVEREHSWERIESIAFFALPPDRGRGGAIPFFARRQDGAFVLRDNPAGGGEHPVFFALPASDTEPATTALYEYRDTQNGRLYSTNPDLADETWQRSAEPLCRVWKNPMAVLALDPNAKPTPQ